jgi:hypothetical protein
VYWKRSALFSGSNFAIGSFFLPSFKSYQVSLAGQISNINIKIITILYFRLNRSHRD